MMKRSSIRYRSFRWPEWFLFSLLLCSLGLAVFKGLSDTSGARGVCNGIFYVAGYALLHGFSPYDTFVLPQLWEESLHKTFLPWLVFPYPPTMLPFVLGLGLLPPAVAIQMIDWINIIALLSIFFVLWKILIHFNQEISSRHLLITLLFTSTVGEITQVFNFGQNSLVFISVLLWALYVLLKKKALFAILLLVIIGSIKPQMTFIPAVVMFLLYARPIQWLLAIGIGVFWGVTISLIFGIEMFSQFFNAAGSYSTLKFCLPQDMTGLPNVFMFFNAEISSFASIGVSVGLVALLLCWCFFSKIKRKIPEFEQETSILLVVTCCLIASFCIPLHYYDLSILVIPMALIFVLPPLMTVVLLPILLIASRPYWFIKLFGLSLTPELVITFSVFISACIALVILIWRPEFLRKYSWSSITMI